MEREEEKKSWHDETLFYWRSKCYLQCIYAKHMGIGYCLLKQWSAYIINASACIINVWGCAEIFPSHINIQNIRNLEVNDTQSRKIWQKIARE